MDNQWVPQSKGRHNSKIQVLPMFLSDSLSLQRRRTCEILPFPFLPGDRERKVGGRADFGKNSDLPELLCFLRIPPAGTGVSREPP